MSSATDAGTRNAAPTPWSTRLATSAATFGATPHRKEPARNTATPDMNVRRRPRRSPVRPPTTSSEPNTIEYAVITHASDAWLAWGYDASRSGNATLTMDRSSAAMNEPSAVTTNTATAVRRTPTSAMV